MGVEIEAVLQKTLTLLIPHEEDYDVNPDIVCMEVYHKQRPLEDAILNLSLTVSDRKVTHDHT